MTATQGDDMTADSTPKTKRIVVGVDGSEESKSALRWAARFAAVTGGGIDAVLAWHTPVSVGWTYAPEDWRPDEDAEQTLANTVDEVFGADRPADIALIVEEGNPAKVLLDHSEGAEMLVTGSRGHGGFAGLLLGSVSSHCAEHATCPVLVVHGDQAPSPLA
jgi:nucleotide-binding universal stress UspA family protein